MQPQSECSAGRSMCRGLRLGEFFALCIRTIYMGCPRHRGPTSSETETGEKTAQSSTNRGEGEESDRYSAVNFFSPPLLIINQHPCIHRWQGGRLPRGYMGGEGDRGWGSASSEWCVWKWEESQQHGSQKHLQTYIVFFFFVLFRVSVGNDKTVECVVLEKKQVPTEKRESLRNKALNLLNLFELNLWTKSEGAVCRIVFFLFWKWWFDRQLCHAELWLFLFIYFFFKFKNASVVCDIRQRTVTTTTLWIDTRPRANYK